MKKFIVIAFMLLGFSSNVSAAPAAYFWNITAVVSDEHNTWEDVDNRSSTYFNHGGTVISETIVLGYSNPVVTYNNSQMQLLQTIPLSKSGSNTIDGWVYYHISSGPSGNIKIIDSGTKDTVYVQ